MCVGSVMPRIRTIKPEFWTDGDVVECSPFARLLFIGMWNFASCDHGHLPDDPVRLKMQILPADPVDVGGLVDELITHGRVQRVITSDGRPFLHIRRFGDHQKVDSRWTPRCPACVTATHPMTPQVSPGLTRSHPNSPKESKGKERIRDKDQIPGSDQPSLVDTTPSATRKPAPAPADRFDEFWQVYPRRVVKARARKAWASAIKKTDAAAILAAASRYAEQHRDTDPQFVAHPASWLNGERWADEARPDDGPRSADQVQQAWGRYAS